VQQRHHRVGVLFLPPARTCHGVADRGGRQYHLAQALGADAARIALPLLAWIASLGFLIWAAINSPAFVVLGIFLFVGAFFWLTWQYEDWRNDLYILTPTQIIDIERTPFLFRESRGRPVWRTSRIFATKYRVLATMSNMAMW